MTTMSETDQKNMVLKDRARGALLGAAIGDALGWPQERPEFNLGKGSRQPQAPLIAFKDWRRRAGGRSQAYEERIRPGEYSDDTQLIIATARSLLKGSQWSGYFVRQELPLWLLYQRGAGRAVNSATYSWQSKKPPWQNETTAKAYFEAGANGAAMRVLPHALFPYPSLAEMQTQVMLNAAITHGHPRAILGAMLYAQAARYLLELTDTLPFGGLVQYLLDTKADWEQLQQWQPGFEDWLKAGQAQTSNGYDALWQQTVKELEDGLISCQSAIKTGALSSGQNFLENLNAFDRSVSGSGAIAALAAIYFVSAYATDPVTGILEVAFANGADTDTLASMTGGLMGALLGTDWIKNEWRIVQDRNYLANLATQLLQNQNATARLEPEPIIPDWNEKNNHQLFGLLNQKDQTQPIELGVLGKAEIADRFTWNKYVKKVRADCWKIKTEVGQTLYITKVVPDDTPPKSVPTQTNFLNPPSTDEKIIISKILFDIQRVIPTWLSAQAGFMLTGNIAALLEADFRTLNKTEFKARLENQEYRNKIAQKVREKGPPIPDKDLFHLIQKIGELLTS